MSNGGSTSDGQSVLDLLSGAASGLSEGIVSGGQSAISGASSLFEPVFNSIGAVVGYIPPDALANVQASENPVPLYNQAQQTIGYVTSAPQAVVQSVANQVGATVTPIVDSASNAVGSAITGAEGAVTATVSALTDALGNAESAVTGAVSGAVSAVTTPLQWIMYGGLAIAGIFILIELVKAVED